MKKLFAMILTAALVLGLAACGGSSAPAATTAAPAKSDAAPAPAADAGAGRHPGLGCGIPARQEPGAGLLYDGH